MVTKYLIQVQSQLGSMLLKQLTQVIDTTYTMAVYNKAEYQQINKNEIDISISCLIIKPNTCDALL